MKHVGMCQLPAAAQEERRRQVIDLSPTGVFNICRRYAEQGAAGLKSGPRGPEPGHGRFLDAGKRRRRRG